MVHPCYCRWQDFIIFMSEFIFHYVCTYMPLVYPLIYWMMLKFFHVLATVNNAAVNIYTCLFDLVFRVSSGKCPEVELLGLFFFFFFVSFYSLCFKVYFVWWKYCYAIQAFFPFVSFFTKYLFSSFQSVWVLWLKWVSCR